MIPEKFKNLYFKYSNDGLYYYVGSNNHPHMMWVSEYYRAAHPDVYDAEGFLILESILQGILGSYDELIFLKDSAEYRQYIKNFVVKSVL